MGSGRWQINAEELTGASVRITPDTATQKTQVRQAFEQIHGGGEVRERLGLNKPRLSIHFNFLGRGVDKYEQARKLTDTLDTDDVWTLEAPSAAPLYIYKHSRRVALSTDSYDLDHNKATGKISIAVSAIVEGIWTTDAGTYCEDLVGHFTRSAGPVYTREDGTATGSTPLVRLPEQDSGYPLAIQASNFQQAVVPISGDPTYATNLDGETIQYNDYDMTGFLIPAPVSNGDVGVYEICSSPAGSFLSGHVSIPAALLGDGIASSAIASTVIGSGS